MQFIQAKIQFASPLYLTDGVFSDQDTTTRHGVQTQLQIVQRNLLQAGEWTLVATDLDSQTLQCDALGNVDGNWQNRLQQVLNQIGEIQSIAVEEITMERFDSDIDSSSGIMLVDTSDLWRAFGLYTLMWNRRQELFEEGFVDTTKQPLVLSAAMKSELQRIEDTKATGKHPAHYLLTATDTDLEVQLGVLFNALQQSDQLPSTRFMRFEYGSRVNTKQLFNASRGATVVIDIPQKLNQFSPVLAELIRAHQNDVLVIVNTPHKLTRQTLMKALPDLLFVALDQSDLTRQEADAYINQALKASNRQRDDELEKRLNDLRYPAAAGIISTTFSAWQSDCKRAEQYPAYVHANANSRPNAEKNGDAYHQLQSLIGLNNVKALIDSILANRRTQMQRQAKGLKVDATSLHMCFTGNPGTAKTTVARLIGKIFRDNGILRVGDMFDFTRSDLVAAYAGQTALQVAQCFAEASGSVMLIDEAYSLSHGQNDQFGQEAIDEIVKLLEDRRDDTVVIFTGYPKEMAQFLDSNSGLASRIAYTVPFADYDATALTAIAKKIAADKDYHLTPKALTKLTQILNQQRAVNSAHFGNGRAVRTLVEHAIINQAQRIDALGHPASTSALKTLLPQDVKAVTVDPIDTKMRQIGF